MTLAFNILPHRAAPGPGRGSLACGVTLSCSFGVSSSTGASAMLLLKSSVCKQLKHTQCENNTVVSFRHMIQHVKQNQERLSSKQELILIYSSYSIVPATQTFIIHDIAVGGMTHLAVDYANETVMRTSR